MIISIKRLNLIPLSVRQLRLLIKDICVLEKELNCSYQVELIDVFFFEIVKGQLNVTEKDPDNFKWTSFWLLICKTDLIVIDLANFKDIPNADNEVEIGYGLVSIMDI